MLTHSGLPQSRERCAAAVAAVWRDRSAFRYNKDVAGRGRAHFSAEQFARLERMLSSYPTLAARRDGLL